MKLLLLSDKESRYLWDFYQPGRLDAYDLILACGDLKADYLTFIATMARVPVLYVRGNHDTRYEQKPPEGCICIEDQVYNYKGLRILGLGGSALYSGGPNQYSERDMERRIRKLRFRLRRSHGVDIVLAHAPAAGYSETEDYAHRGFSCFLDLIDKYQPKFFIHGHVHMNYGRDIARERERNGTKIINAYERYEITTDEP